MKEYYYYNHLQKQQQRVYLELKKGLEALSEEFVIPMVDETELGDIFFKLRLDCPEIFYAENYKYFYYRDSNLYHIRPEYLFDKGKIKEHQAAMKNRVERLVRPVKDKSDLEKEQYIHDFICQNVTYDKLKKQYSHEIIGPLGQGVGVCEGIAKTVKILCDALSVPCVVLLSKNNPEKNIKYAHAWNAVKLQGKWYHLDATFDNTLGKNGEIRYDYFNLSDEQVFRDHEPLAYPAIACVDKEHFYYREKKLSFTKMEDVYKRSLQAVKKNKSLTFHYRGGYLTRAIVEELVNQISAAAKTKEKHYAISVNWPQGIVNVSFLENQMTDTVRIEDGISGLPC